MKSYNYCHTCKNKITGVERWEDKFVYCVKCHNILEKEKQAKREYEKKNWYRSDMTDYEFYHKVFDLFC